MKWAIGLASIFLVWLPLVHADSLASKPSYNRADINIVGSEDEAKTIRQQRPFAGATRSAAPLAFRINLRSSGRSGYVDVYNSGQEEWIPKYVGESGQVYQGSTGISELANLAGCNSGWSKVVLQLTNSTARAKVYVNSGFIGKVTKEGDLDKDIGGFCKDKPLAMVVKKAKCEDLPKSLPLSENPQYVKEQFQLKCK